MARAINLSRGLVSDSGKSQERQQKQPQSNAKGVLPVMDGVFDFH